MHQETNKLIAESSKSSGFSSDTKTIVDSINLNNDYNNIHRYDLPDDRKFGGRPQDLLYWLRHITHRVLTHITKPEVQWESILRNLHDPIYSMAVDMQMQFNSTEEAICQFINHLINTYGNRYSIAILTIENFLKNIRVDTKSHADVINFANDLRILRDTLAFIGCSSCINNLYFLRNLLQRLPPPVTSAWDRYESSADPFIRDIFKFDKKLKLCYNLNPRPNPNYKGV